MPNESSLTPDTLSMNQVVALNVGRLRKERDLTQAQAAQQLQKQMGGPPWSVAAWSAAERSVESERNREFDADLLVALAAALEVEVADLLTPPPDVAVRLGGEGRVIDAEDLEELIRPRPVEPISPETLASVRRSLRGMLRELSQEV